MTATAQDVNAFLCSHRSGLRGPIPTTPIGFHAFLRRGVPVGIVTSLAGRYGFTHEDLATLLNISAATLARRTKRQQRFTGAEADAIYRLLGTLGVATRVLKADGNIASWLRRSQPALRGHRPIDLIGTHPGAEAVSLLLEQVHHGLTP